MIIEKQSMPDKTNRLTTDLRALFNGRVIAPEDPGYDEARTLFYGGNDRRPAAIIQALDAGDVARVVSLAQNNGLELAVRGGGHSIAGHSTSEGGIILDLSAMKGIEIDVEQQTAWAEAGLTAGEYTAAAGAYGLATGFGDTGSVGIGGLTLGGGIGFLVRKYGMTIDDLLAAEIVTADGQLRYIGEKADPDLFWAIRGGGGNFGVVTRFKFRLHEVGPTITGGLIAWSADRADDVLATYQELTASAPRELTVAALIRLAPPAPFVPEEWHFKPVVGLLVCHSGRTADADLAPVRAIEEPIFDLVGEKPYTAQQSLLDDTEPKGLHQYWKAEFLPDLSSDYLSTFRDAALNVASPLSFSVIFHLAGALNERDSGAVGNRDAQFISGFSGVWPPQANGEGIVAAVREGWEKIRPFSTGGNYVNFQLAEDDVTRTAEAYGGNYERLRQVKAQYDPGNLFRVNRNIHPVG